MRLSLKMAFAMLMIGSSAIVGQARGASYQLPSGADLVPQVTHEGRGATTIALSPDNTIAVIGGYDRQLQFWDLPSGRLLRSVEAYDKSVNRLAIVIFSPDGHAVLTAPSLTNKSEGDSGKVKLWDVATGKLVHVYDVEFPAALAFAADGRRFLAGSSAGLLTLRDVDTGALIKRYEDRKVWGENAVAVAVTQDAGMVVSVGSNGTIRRWSAESGEKIEDFGARGFVTSVSFTRDARFIFACQGIREGRCALWNVDAGKLARSFGFGWSTQEEPMILPDLSGVLKIRSDGTAAISNLTSGDSLKTLGGGHAWGGYFDFSTRGSYVLLMSREGALELWDYATGALVHSTTGSETRIGDLVFSASGDSFLGRCDASVCEWNVARGDLIRRFQEEGFALGPLAVSASGNRIVLSARPNLVATADGGGFVAGFPVLELWDSLAGTKVSGLGEFSDPIQSFNNFAPSALAAFSLDGKSLLTASALAEPQTNWADFSRYESRSELRDAATGELKASRRQGQPLTAAIAFSSEGETYVSASTNGNVIEWPPGNENAPRAFSAAPPGALLVSYSGDGKRIWAVNRNGQLRSWDERGVEAPKTFDGFGKSIVAAAAAPDKRAVLLAYADDSLKLWNVETGELIRTFEGSRDKVKSLSVSPDGRRAVSTNSDNTADLWDVQSGKLVATWFFVDGQAVALTPEGYFMTQAQPNRAFAIVRGLELLPIDKFVAKNRIEALPEPATTHIAPTTP